MKPGRHRLTCKNCKTEFSTHSGNREQCYKCLPKCQERHTFGPGHKTLLMTNRAAEAAAKA